MNTRRMFHRLSALALATVAFSASAANVPLGLDVATPVGANWYVSSFNGCGDEGELPVRLAADSDCILSIIDADFNEYGDAYDGGWLTYVNGTPVTAPEVDFTGTTVTAPAVQISGLDVTTQYYFAPNSAVARILVTLHNPGNSSVAAEVQIPTNYGSDSGTVYAATSSGDAAITTADRWIISSDGGPWDPVNTSVFYGPGAVAETPVAYATTVHDAAGDEGIGATFALDIPAHGTQSLMFFAGLNGITSGTNTVAAATTAAAAFDNYATLQPEWLAGLSSIQRGQIVNWNPASLGGETTTCASSGYTGTKLNWCRIICESESSSSTIDTYLRRWINKYRDLPYCAVEGGGEELPPQG